MPLLACYILLALLGLFFAIHLFYWCFGSLRLVFGSANSHQPIANSSPPLSVIICARNEAKHIKKNLTMVLEQDYPVFEVIVVDDCSWDSTHTVLLEVEKDYPRLKILQLKEDTVYKHGKKLALTIAIKKAQYEHLVFTDADCHPSSNQWLKQMASAFNPTTEIVLGYGAYENKKGFINKLIRMDTFRIGLQYLSFAVAGVPYMGIGRNMAYRKSLFLKQKGFSPHSQIPSGDDDLFVNKAANKHNTKIAASPTCTTISIPEETFKDWLNQKRRHVSTSQYYNSQSKILLGILTLNQYFFWFTAVALLFSHFWHISAIVIGVYLILQLIIYRKAMNQLGEKELFLYSLLLEWFILFIFYPTVAISNLLFKQVIWKT